MKYNGDLSYITTLDRQFPADISTAWARQSGRTDMTRDEIKSELLRICRETFEFENPGLDDDLRDVYDFDSIDAIELLREIELMLGTKLTREEKEGAMEVRTLNHVLDYIEALQSAREPQDQKSGGNGT